MDSHENFGLRPAHLRLDDLDPARDQWGVSPRRSLGMRFTKGLRFVVRLSDAPELDASRQSGPQGHRFCGWAADDGPIWRPTAAQWPSLQRANRLPDLVTSRISPRMGALAARCRCLRQICSVVQSAIRAADPGAIPWKKKKISAGLSASPVLMTSCPSRRIYFLQAMYVLWFQSSIVTVVGLSRRCDTPGLPMAPMDAERDAGCAVGDVPTT